MQFLTLARFSKLHSLDVSESDIGHLSVENVAKILPGLKGNCLFLTTFQGTIFVLYSRAFAPVTLRVSEIPCRLGM